MSKRLANTNRTGLLLVASMMAMVVVMHFATSRVTAQQLSDEQAVEAGREALEGTQRFPWYDAEGDGLQRLDVEPPDDVANRDSKWERIKRQKKNSNWQLPEWMWPIFEALGWMFLVVALAAVGYLLVRTFLITETGSASGEAHKEGVLGPGDVDRVEALPFQLQAPKSDLLSEARRLYEAGNYKDAIIYFYSYQLVELDKHQLIRLTKGKTNRQYTAELRPRMALRSIVTQTMLAFEDVFFGHHQLSKERFEVCWSQIEVFNRELQTQRDAINTASALGAAT